MNEQNNIPNDQQTKVWEILQEVAEKSAGGGYIYRGEPKDYGKVSSNLYRQYKDIDVENFKVEDVQKEILEKAKQYTDKTDEFEILAELQHYGGKTNLIDFTTDYHIALFFACDGSHDKCGRLILQKRQNLVVYQPREPRNRVIAQKSIFVRPDAGFIDPDEVIIIPAELKQLLLKHLRDYHGIFSETIYNDLHGFIKIQAIHEKADTAFYTGLTDQDIGKYKQAIKHYTKAIALKPDYAEAYNNRGAAKYSLDQHVEAIKDYDQAIRLKSNFAEAYNNRGAAKNSLGQHVDAIADYNHSIKLKPDYAEIYYNRGNAKRDLGEHEDAINDYDQAIRLNPDYAADYLNRGVAKNGLGKRDEAITDYDEAIRLNPDVAEAYLNRGVAKNGLGQHEKAIEDYDKAIQLQPDYSDAYGNLGIAKQNLERYAEAIEDYDEAIKRNSTKFEFYHARGVAKCGLDRYEDALTDFDKFIQLKPNYAYEPYFYRGFVKNKLDKHKEAIEDYNEAIILNPDFAEAYLNRVLSYLATNQPQEARRDFETARDLAQQAGDENLVALADQGLRNLDAPDEDE